MTTTKYLRQIERYDRLIKNKRMEIERLESLLETIPALPYDQDKIMSSGSQDKIGNDVATLLDDKCELEDLLRRYSEKRKHIIEQIESMPDNRHLTVLSLVYLEYKELWEIPNETNYTYTYVKNLHSNALKEFEKRYGKEYLKSCYKK